MKHKGHILEFVTKLITDRPKANREGLKQNQREAIIDALLYCLFADDYDDPAEQCVLEKSIVRLNWESGTSVDDYILSASERGKLAVSSQNTEQHLPGFLQRACKE